MNLIQLKNHLKQHHECSLRDLALRFDSDAQVLRHQLALLERKGLVKKLPSGTLCSSGCRSCATEQIDLYRWVAAEEGGAVPLRFGNSGRN
jgi:putative ferrous iron transport protein C